MGFEDQLQHDTLTSLLGLAWVLMRTDVFRCAPSKDEILFQKNSFNRYLLRSSQCTKYFELVGSLYAISLQPLVTRLHVSSAAKQCWFVCDPTGSGSPQDVRK